MQVERDPRTGVSLVTSVAPVSTAAGASMATTVFDDGRKSIYVVSGTAGQPSTEELGQILSVIDGIGIKVLLDEVTVTPNKAETKKENTDANIAPEGKIPSLIIHHTMSVKDDAHLDSSKSNNLEAELVKDDCAAKDNKEDSSIMMVTDIAGEAGNVEDLSLGQCPVTLLFLGYADSTSDQAYSQEGHEGMLTVERVIITDEGEEHVSEPETSPFPQAVNEFQDPVFQDILLVGHGAAEAKDEDERGHKGLHKSSLPSKPEEGGISKCKTCQCCSVM